MMILELFKNNKKSDFRKNLIDYMLIIIGTILMAISINLFLLPSKITTGGASGIGTILYYLFDINISTTILILNIPLFIIAILKMGFKFSIKSIVGTLFFSFFLNVINFEEILLKNNIDIFLSSVYGGLLLGIGVSLVFKANASTGGSDLLASIIHKYNKKLNMSKLMLVIDSIIIMFLIITLKDLNIGLYSAIAIFISSKIIEIIFEGANYTKIVNIITKNDDAIPNMINKILERGATVTKCIGAYSRGEMINITCIATVPEIGKIKDIVYNIDEHALVYVTSANEVIGRGFKKYI